MRFQLAILYVIVFFSGFAGLGYEMAWTRMLSVGLGHEAVSVLAVVADYLGLEAKGVELVPEIIPLLHLFERATGNLNRLPRFDAVVADARRYVNCSREKIRRCRSRSFPSCP